MARALVVAALASTLACRPAARADREEPVDAALEATAVADGDADAGADAAADARDGEAREQVATDWCVAGLHALDEDVCYVLPARAKEPPRRLLVYLHGITPPLPSSPQKENVQTVVKRAAERAGAAALVPRGRRGIGPAGAHDWYAWPTSAAAHAELAGPIVERLAAAKKKLEQLAGGPFERTYLAGSSNGAYFVTALLVRGDAEAHGLPIDGYGAMSGGGGGGAAVAVLRARPARRVYVGYGAYDEPSKRNATGLTDLLRGAAWPTKVAEHPFGHGAREVYLDEAFAFWDGL